MPNDTITTYFIPISNDPDNCGAVCNDDRGPDGRIIDEDGRYEQVERLHPGEPGYVLYGFDAEHADRVREAYEGGYVDYRFARYVASYRDNPPTKPLAKLKDAIREELRAHTDGLSYWHLELTEVQLGKYLANLKQLRELVEEICPPF